MSTSSRFGSARFRPHPFILQARFTLRILPAIRQLDSRELRMVCRDPRNEDFQELPSIGVIPHWFFHPHPNGSTEICAKEAYVNF